MATIDQEGLEEVKKVKDALTHLYDKIAASGVSANDEYSFIFKILTQMEDEWEHNVNRVYTVPDELTINGKRYTS